MPILLFIDAMTRANVSFRSSMFENKIPRYGIGRLSAEIFVFECKIKVAQG